MNEVTSQIARTYRPSSNRAAVLEVIQAMVPEGLRAAEAFEDENPVDP
jgi:hypothetical protein